MTFNTGNPVPSTDSKDLSDNAENFDSAVNNLVNDTWVDRLGVTRDTVNGRIKKMGYATPINYTSGISFTVSDNVKTVDESGIIYAPLPSELPFTTTNWSTDESKFFVIQGITNTTLESELQLKNYLGVKNLSGAVSDAEAYEGGYVRISDRSNWLFQYQAGQANNSYNIIECTGVSGLSLVAQKEYKTITETTITSAIANSNLQEGDLVEVLDMENNANAGQGFGGKNGSLFYVVLASSVTTNNLDIRQHVNPLFALQLKNSDTVNITDLEVSKAGFERAIELLNTGDPEFTGGVVEIPTGQSILNEEVIIPISEPINSFINMTFKGTGKEGSSISFLDADPTDNGFVFDGGPFYSMRDMSVFRAKQSGIFMKKTPVVWNHVYFSDMGVRANLLHGINAEQGFMATFARLFVTNNSSNGFNFQGLHTSLSFDNCYAASNGTNGYDLTHVTYSTMNASASDNNGQHGYKIKKSHSFKISGTGSENNGRSGFNLTSSTAEGANTNISLDSVFGFTNNTANAGFANLVHMTALDGVGNSATLFNSVSTSPANPIEDVIVDGEGAFLIEGYNDLPNGVMSRNGGYIQHIPKIKLIKQLSVTSPTTVVELTSSQGHQTHYAGEITVRASNGDPSSISAQNTAVYKLLVNKGAGGEQVVEMASTGLTSGAGASFPSFTWSLSSNNLTATPISSTSGSFYFEVLTDGMLKVV